MRMIDRELEDAIKDVLRNEGTGGLMDGYEDLTATTKESCDRLRDYMKRYSEQHGA